MGTSSSFRGKKGSALIPNDFDNEKNKNNEKEKEINWTNAKSLMSKFISSGGKIGSAKQVTRNYIKASGGTKKIISNSNKSKNVIINLGKIVKSFTTNGIVKTFESLGISLKSYSMSEAMSKLVNYVHKSAVSKDDVAIRSAIANTMEKILEVSNEIDKLDEDTAEILMQYFFSDLIWEEMLIDYGYSFEKYGSNLNDLQQLESEIKEYIKACVEEAFNETRENAFSKDSLDTILEKSLKIMEE